MKMVKGFESMLAGSLDLAEPWYITGAEFNPVKNVIDVYVGIREDAVIACPHCGVQQVTAPFEQQNSRHPLLFEGYATHAVYALERYRPVLLFCAARQFLKATPHKWQDSHRRTCIL